MRRLRQTFRLCSVLLHVLWGIVSLRFALLWDRLRRHPLHGGLARRVQARWCRRLCRILRLRIRVEGEELGSGAQLVVANHISWLDVPVIAALWGVGFLSKSEVRGWPLIGPVATGLGTLYIERGRKDAAGEAAQVMRRRLEAGHPVLFFPEGTTSDGRGLLPFRPRLYQSALDAGVPVRPLALSYHGPDGSLNLAAPFIDQQVLLAHLIRLCAEPALEVRVRVGPALTGQGRTQLARASRTEIGQLLGWELEQTG